MKKGLYLFVAMTTMVVCFQSCTKHDFFDPTHSHPHGDNSSSRVPVDWYKMQLRLLLERNSTLNGVYFGYLGIGLYESVRFENRHSVSLSKKLYQMPEMPAKENTDNYNWEVSANAAMASMLKSFNVGLTPADIASIDSLENAYNEKLKPGAGVAAFVRSQAFGRAVATAIHDWSTTDNFDPSNVGYVPPVFPGAWIPTPPAYANGIQPYISKSRTFLEEDLTELDAPPPFAYNELPNSPFYKMVKKLYDVSKTLTEDQTNIALYYADQGNGIGYTPPGHDFSILTQVIEQTKANLFTAAEAYAKSGIAERDGSIVCFRDKYKYSQLRPVSYIQKVIDPSWLPLIVTPPHPEYPAAHAYITSSVLYAATSVLGDHIAFTDHTYDFRGLPSRSHESLIAAAEETGMSRLYGGIHYLNSINIGHDLGKTLAGKIARIKVQE